MAAILQNEARLHSEIPVMSAVGAVSDIQRIVDCVRKIHDDIVIMVDNCYGEFVEIAEPCSVGADLCAGSLIKNPGAGIAPTGGYVVGREDLVERVAMQMTAPGVGSHIGPTLGQTRLLAQGIYLAPRVVAESLKIAVHCAALFSKAGYRIDPAPDADRADIVQTIELGTPEKLIAFCEATKRHRLLMLISRRFLRPCRALTVILLWRPSFIQGSSIELSADGPLREPYAAFLQGGLSFESGRLGAMLALSKIDFRGSL